MGAGGLNIDPYEPERARVGRLRHLYVLPAWRRRGVGRLLVARLVAAARGVFNVVQLRAPASGAADAFYAALGFEVVAGHPPLHPPPGAARSGGPGSHGGVR